MKILTYIMYLVIGMIATVSVTTLSTIVIAECIQDANTFSAVSILMFILLGMSGFICTYVAAEALIEKQYPTEY